MARMTAAAGHAPMLLAQGEFGIPIMVEDDLFPHPVCMAGLAVLAIVSFVHVVLFVARVAGEWRGPVLPVGMASFAVDLFMLAEERKFRFVVVKEMRVLPLFLRVTLFAGTA